jgi:hypothetical protein
MLEAGPEVKGGNECLPSRPDVHIDVTIYYFVMRQRSANGRGWLFWRSDSDLRWSQIEIR